MSENGYPQIDGAKEGAKLRKGLGGWMILVVIGCVFTPVLLAKDFVEIIAVFQSPVSPIWHTYLQALLITDVIFIGLSVYLCVQLFNETRRFPKAYIAVQVAYVCRSIWICYYTYKIIGALDEDMLAHETVRFGLSLVWIIYMLRSRRVKATFR